MGNVFTGLVAGIDTTAMTFIQAMYLLACNQDIQTELREEVKDIHLEDITLQELYTKVPRLKSFFHEVHRCYGVPFLMLQADKDIPFCGSTLSQGTNIMLLSRYISKQKESPAVGVPLGPDQVQPNRTNSLIVGIWCQQEEQMKLSQW